MLSINASIANSTLCSFDLVFNVIIFLSTISVNEDENTSSYHSSMKLLL